MKSMRWTCWSWLRLGRLLVCKLIVWAIWLSSSLATAQTCKFHSDAPDSIIVIDGKPYEYISIERSKARLKEIEAGRSAQEKVKLLEHSLELKDDMIASYEGFVGTLMSTNETNTKLIEQIVPVTPKGAPFFERPVVNFAIGFLVSTGAYAVWQYAENQANN